MLLPWVTTGGCGTSRCTRCEQHAYRHCAHFCVATQPGHAMLQSRGCSCKRLLALQVKLGHTMLL
jgi:hypothetical protein